MASNSVDYIIRLVADDSELKKKLSSGELLNASERAKLKKLIVPVIKEAQREADNLGSSLQDNLNVDTTKLEHALEFISGIFDDLGKTSNPMKDWAKTGKGVYDAFENMQNSVGVLAQNVKTLQGNLSTLNTSFESFKKSYQSFNPTQFITVTEDVEKLVDATAKLQAKNLFGGNDSELDQKVVKLKKLRGLLESLTDTEYKLEISDADLEKEFKATAKKLEELWDSETTKGAEVKEAQLLARMQALEKRQVARGGKSFIYGEYTRASKESYEETLKDWGSQVEETAGKVQRALTKLEDDINKSLGKSFAKVISEQVSDIHLSLALPNEDEFVNDINQYIAKINAKPFDPIQVKIAESANVIDDKSRQKHKDKPATDDANTDALVNKTDERFKRVQKVIDDRQQAILDNTDTWRKKMVAAMKIASNDLEFEFGWDKKLEGGAQKLMDGLQEYFNMPGNELNIHIDHEALAQEIKSALENGGITANIAGGNTTIDAASMAELMKTLLYGAPQTTSQPKVDVQPSVPPTDIREEVQAKEESDQVTKSYVTHLDASTESVKSFISALKQFVGVVYAKRASAGAKAIGNMLSGYGIDLKAIKDGKVTDVQIANQLTNALLEQDEMGYAKGSTIVDTLISAIKTNKINVKSKNGQVIDALPLAFARLLDDNDIIRETKVEWERRNHGFDVTKYGIDSGRSLGLLNRARYAFKPGTKRKVNVDGGMFDVGNDFKKVAENLQKERENLVAKLTKEKEELAQLQANMPEGQKSTYETEYEAAKQLASEAKLKRKQAEAERQAVEEKFKAAHGTPQASQLNEELKAATANVDEMKKEEQKAIDLERQTLGTWQNAQQRVVRLANSIAKAEKLLESFKALDSMQTERAKLGDKPTDDAMEKFKAAGAEFYEKSKALFEYLNSKFKFKGYVAINGNDELIPINTPNDILKNIPEGAKITYVEPTGDHSNSVVGGGAVGSTQYRQSNFRKANSQERRWVSEGGRADYLGSQHRNKDIMNEDISYKPFSPLGVNVSADVSGDIEKQKIQRLDTEIQSAQTRLTEIDAKIATKEQEINELTTKYAGFSDKKKQNAQSAVETQERVVADVNTRKESLDLQLKEAEHSLEQAVALQARLQNEVDNVSETDVERVKNDIRRQIKDLEAWEPLLKEDVKRLQPDYDVAKQTLQYADTRVNNRQNDLTLAKTTGDAKQIEDATTALEQAIAERTRAQVEFNAITQKLNEANNKVTSNASQRDNLYNQLQTTNIDTVREQKQADLNDAIARVQTLTADRDKLAIKLDQAENSLKFVKDELDRLKQSAPYKTKEQLDQAQREMDVLASQKSQTTYEIATKEKEKENAIFLSKRLELQRQYNALQTKALEIQSAMNQMNESDSGLVAKKEELEQINKQLEETKTKLQDLGGMVLQEGTEVTDSQRHKHGLDSANQYQAMLDIAYQQEEELKSRIDAATEKERQVKKFGASQYDVARNIAVKKTALTRDFMSSDYVKAQLAPITQNTQEKVQQLNVAFNERISELMKQNGLDPMNKDEYQKFLESRSELTEELASQTDKLWEENRRQQEQKREQLKKDFTTKMNDLSKGKDGMVYAPFQTEKDGKWVTDVKPYDVKQEYLDEQTKKKKAAQEQLNSLRPKISDMEHQKTLAMTYGGVTEPEITHVAQGLTQKLGQATRSIEGVSQSADGLANEMREDIGAHQGPSAPQGTSSGSAPSGGMPGASTSNGGASQGTGGLIGVIKSDISGAIGGMKSDLSEQFATATSHLATEDTLKAIRDLLGGDGFAEDDTPSGLMLSRNEDPNELDIHPLIPLAQEVEEELLKTVGKSLHLKELQSIVGSSAAQIFTEQGDPTRSLDKHEFYEKNRSEIFKRALESALSTLNGTPQEDVKTKLYNQFVDWLNQIAQETFNISGLPIDKFKDAIENIWIPAALDAGKTDISQLNMSRTSGQNMIENRLGLQVSEDPVPPPIVQEAVNEVVETVQESIVEALTDTPVDPKLAERYATKMLTHQRVATYGTLDERVQSLKERQYSLYYDPNRKEGRQEYWTDVRNLFGSVSTFLNGIKSDFVGDVRKGDFSNVGTYIEAVDAAEQKLRELENFFVRIKNVDISYKKEGMADATERRDKLLGDVSKLRNSLTTFLSQAMQQAVTESMRAFMPQYSSSLDADYAKDIVNTPLGDIPNWKELKTNNGDTDWNAILQTFNDLDSNLTDLESGALYLARMGKWDGLKHAQQILASYKQSMADFEVMFSELPETEDKTRNKIYNDLYKTDTLEKINQIESRIQGFLPQNTVPDEAPNLDAQNQLTTAIDNLRKAIGDFDMRSSNAKKAELFNSLGRDVLDDANIVRARVKNNEASREEIALYNKLVKLREAANKVAGQSKPVETSGQPQTSESPIEDDEELDPQMLERIFAGITAWEQRIASLESTLTTLEGNDDADAQTQRAELQADIKEAQQQLDETKQLYTQMTQSSQPQHNTQENTDALIHNTEAINDNSAKSERSSQTKVTTSGTPNGQPKSPGIIGVMRQLAKESTLSKVLSALGEIAKKNATSNKSNSAQDLLEQFRRMLESDEWEGRERVAYMDLATGSMSNAITGDGKSISAERLNVLRSAYRNKMDLNAQVHTHANKDDPYFSQEDLKLFASDFADGITKQILLSKNNMTVLDMTDVKDVNGLLDALSKTEHNFEALATAASKFGAQYVSQAFNEITPQGLVKMLGIKSIESKYTESETRDSAIEGVAKESAKESADVLAESTGRVIKKTVERAGAELLTITEKLDAKGNKTWTSQLNNKFEKGMLATHREINPDKLDATTLLGSNMFGVDTKGHLALDEYLQKYQKLNALIEEFRHPKDRDKSAIQTEINSLLPEFQKAESALVDLINHKDRFLGYKDSVTTFSQSQLDSKKDSLQSLAIHRYATQAGYDNIAFNGMRGNSLLVDVLKDGTITEYALEVDEATGKVKEFVTAENALVNAFQNVNSAMRFDKIVMADVAVTDNGSGVNTNAPELKAYSDAKTQLENAVREAWSKISSPNGLGMKNLDEGELDYIMTLSEHVINLGKSLQKTSVAFKNFWAQNPDKMKGSLTLSDNMTSDDVRNQMEQLARTSAGKNYDYQFSSFDGTTLKYQLTDATGAINEMQMAWSALYNQVAVFSDKSVAKINPVVAKVQNYEDAIQQAIASNYLMSDSADVTKFNDIQNEIREIVQGIQNGTTSYADQKSKLDELRRSALEYGKVITKTINTNKRLYTGTTELNSANRQRDKIVGLLGQDTFDNGDTSVITKYKAEYQSLMDAYNSFKTEGTLYDPKNQEQLRQQAALVQSLGKHLMTSTNQAVKLQELVDQSGTYVNSRGKVSELGGKSNPLTATEIKNLKATMQDYVQNTLGQGQIENVKFNKTTQQLTYTFRTSKDTVADMVVQYNAAENALFAYNKQERESLTGFPALWQSMKSKTKSLLQYTASMTSIHRALSELRKGVQYVRDIDLALTELKKVTDETDETYERFLNTASKTASKVGSTIKEVVSSAADFARLGYTLEEATQLAESAQILMNVSEFTDISSATDSLISAIQAFSYTADESLHVVDIMNTIGKHKCRGDIVIYDQVDNYNG